MYELDTAPGSIVLFLCVSFFFLEDIKDELENCPKAKCKKKKNINKQQKQVFIVLVKVPEGLEVTVCPLQAREVTAATGFHTATCRQREAQLWIYLIALQVLKYCAGFYYF